MMSGWTMVVSVRIPSRLGDEEDELAGAPRLVEASRDALGAGAGAPQEHLRVKNGLERGQRGSPRR
jgi:hypothetical protein